MVSFRSLRSKRRPALELRKLLERGAAQFEGLNPREPGQWPILPKVAAWGLMLLAVLAVGWALVLAEAATRLDAQRGRVFVLRDLIRNVLQHAHL